MAIVYTIDMCEMGTPICSSNNSGAPAADAFENNLADGWESGESGVGVNGVSYLGYQWSSKKTVKKIRFYTSSDSARMVTSVKVQYSPTGSTWADAQTFSSLNTSVQVWNELVIDGDYKGVAWRMLANSAATGSGHWNVKEVEMQGAIGRFERQSLTLRSGSTESVLLSEGPVSFPTGTISTNISGFDVTPAFNPMNRTDLTTTEQLMDFIIYYTFSSPVIVRRVEVGPCTAWGNQSGTMYTGVPAIYLKYRQEGSADWVYQDYGYGNQDAWRGLNYTKAPKATKYWAIVFRYHDSYGTWRPCIYFIRNLRIFSQQSASSSNTIAFI